MNQPAEPTECWNSDEERKGSSDTRIGLCLSGGGLRATFFHLGVVRALRELGLLDRVTDIFSVSGGSILSAHLAINWDDYTGNECQFAQVESEIRHFGKSDIRGRVVRRWLIGVLIPLLWPFAPLYFRRTTLLRRQYNQLYKHRCLAD